MHPIPEHLPSSTSCTRCGNSYPVQEYAQADDDVCERCRAERWREQTTSAELDAAPA